MEKDCLCVDQEVGAEVCPDCQGKTLKSEHVPNGICHEVLVFVYFPACVG